MRYTKTMNHLKPNTYHLTSNTYDLRPKKAFTLIEILIVVAVIGILAVLAMTNWKGQLNKAKDTQRKKDLNRLRTAFEEYYNDHNCYPPSDILNNCGGSELQPYLNSIPCDPETHTPYYYVFDENNPSCGQEFRILTTLRNNNDQAIKKLGCDPESGCGYKNENQSNYNYGVTSTNTSLTTPSPSPSLNGHYACDPQGICNYYNNPIEANCPITFNNPNCNNQCSNPSTHCSQ